MWVCTDFVDLADADAALRATYACTRQWTDESTDRAGSSAPGGGLADAPPADRLFRACELRVVRADSEDSWLSPVRGRDSLVIHFSISAGFGEDTEAGSSFGVVGSRAVECCAELEEALAPFSARPHWSATQRSILHCVPTFFDDGLAGRGKLFTLGKEEVEAVYGAEAIAEFRALAAKHDPEAKFRNGWVDSLLF